MKLKVDGEIYSLNNALEYKEKFKIPNNYKISHAIALGYRKNEIAKASPRKENVYTIIK